MILSIDNNSIVLETLQYIDNIPLNSLNTRGKKDNETLEFYNEKTLVNFEAWNNIFRDSAMTTLWGNDFLDTLSNIRNAVNVAGGGVQLGSNYLQDLAEGKFSDRTLFDKFGQITNVTSSQGQFPLSIWFGRLLYTGQPDLAEELEVFSSSDNDNVGGTGARQIIISNLLDENFNEMPDVLVNLAGTTPVDVNLGQTYLRCSRAFIVQSGSSQRNEGNITIRHKTTVSNIFAVMPAEKSQTQILNYTVPIGKTLFISKGTLFMLRANGSEASADIEIQKRDFGTNTWRTILPITLNTASAFEIQDPIKFDEKTDIRSVVTDVSDNVVNIAGQWVGTLKNNI